MRWEIFQGRLLPPSQTRAERVFDHWELYLVGDAGCSGEPVLALRADWPAGQLHVVRGVECWIWEPYEAEDRVILSREARKWVPELVGTLALQDYSTAAALAASLRHLLFLAVVGTSRLPLTSPEAPLPDFSLGLFGYPGQVADAAPSAISTSPSDLLARWPERSTVTRETVKLLELLLRIPSAEPSVLAAELTAAWRAKHWTKRDVLPLFRRLFHEVALSPYTAFAAQTLAVLGQCVQGGFLTSADLADFLGFLLRQLVRHLTAYDLVNFHHRGANYPDALLLDLALNQLLQLAANEQALFAGCAAPGKEPDNQRLRRRALRQGLLLRQFYEGLPVPAHPTSPGENARVLPPQFPRIPEDEILDPARRTHRLFANAPLPPALLKAAQTAIQASMDDLEKLEELHELGMALFADRPLGGGKPPGEPDQTLLVVHEAFSLTLARQRLDFLEQRGWLSAQNARSLLDANPPRGYALPPAPRGQRPGVVTVRDAARAAPDFRFLRTTRDSLRAFADEFDLAPLAAHTSLDWLDPRRGAFLLCDPAVRPDLLLLLDSQGQPRLELHIDASAGYRRYEEREVPVPGLRVLRLGQGSTAVDLGTSVIYLRPRI